MAGIAIVLDLLRKNPSLTTQSLHASGFFSAKAAAAAASVAAGAPYVYKSFFSNFRVPVAYCDAGATLSEDYTSNVRSASLKIFQNESVNFGTKEYTIELKPQFSAFELRALTLMTLRSFLMFYLPLLEPRRNLQEDDDDFLRDTEEEQHVDYVAPFKKSLKKIARDATVSTTKRILERISVHYVSQRMAWKLLKDTSKSAMRKAGRRMPTYVFFFSVSKMTMRGHFLDVAASWIISVSIDIYRTFSGMTNSKEVVDEIDTPQKLKRLGNKVWGTTFRCGASLIFASIGAGIGATLFRPSTGQWIGRILGDVAGPIIVSYCLEKSFHAKL
ncbi:hypothetical protein RchiOBHm_Chr5g0077271 [Rosa chinensis]|uniref:Uncharacterized protein n=1 Tax=Rosa chinensis TaxID=74649 RepID=A0A2P6QLZ7_ROSCH|nr:uncharacterized protein LOC112164286 [Rosa chinensis]PRQ35186.1 hypothetical protein RchiOBHm_Chr5g0077271 [Rosa chinensis]